MRDNILYKILKIILLRKKKTYISRHSDFYNALLSSNVEIKAYTDVSFSMVGVGSYLGRNCLFRYTSIGKFCSIGDNVIVVSNNHPVKDYVSTHPAFHRPNHPLMKKLMLDFDCKQIYPEFNKVYHKKFRTCIGSDVWIGTNVTIIEGVNIGDGAVIACGSVVTRDVDAYSIVAGVPAKIIKYRFSAEEIEKLLTSRWWDWEFQKIKKTSYYFNDINKFLSFLERE